MTRVLPHNLDAEASILGGIILRNDVLAQLDALEVEDFYDLKHKVVFQAVRNLAARQEPIDVITLEAEIERQGKLDAVGGIGFLGELALRVPTPDNIVAYAEIVRGKRLLVEVALAATRAVERAHDWPDEPDELLGELVADLRRIEHRHRPRKEQQGFQQMHGRIGGELANRLALAARALKYQIPYLDDCLRVILPHDLVLLGAPTGLGKTELALAIAMANASAARRVAYFALEAEPLELERRIKYAWLSSLVYRSSHERRHHMRFTDWLLGELEDVCGPFNAQVDERFVTELAGLQTFYRGAHFTTSDLCKAILEVHQNVDLIVIDHLHYIDLDADENEQAALGQTIKAIRDVSLRVGRPVLLVAHLRKKDQRMKQIIPHLEDFHGSSNITKVCTQIITLERAYAIEAPKWWLSPTYMAVLKDRREGANGLIAMTHFDRRTRSYVDHYTLGRPIKGGTEWEPLKPIDSPMWARSNRQLELELGDRHP